MRNLAGTISSVQWPAKIHVRGACASKLHEGSAETSSTSTSGRNRERSDGPVPCQFDTPHSLLAAVKLQSIGRKTTTRFSELIHVRHEITP